MSLGNTGLSRYPNGFGRRGVSVRGVPLLSTFGNKVFWVHSGTGAEGNDGSENQPFATIDRAFSFCSASRGDIVMVKAGHAETLAAAGAIAADVAGVSIVGLGTGANRPTLTFGTAVGASVLITAANISIENIIGVSGVDALTNPFHVQAAGCSLDIEWQDPSSSLQAVRAILTTDAADKLFVKLKVVGIISGGTAPVNAVRLVGVDTATVVCDFYGRASTAFVEFLTTACTNISVSGYMYNSGTTNGSKNVIDTATGSTWYADLVDGAAGANYSGGSAAALASDDSSTIAANQTVPTADVTTNTLSRDVVGNKADAAAQTLAATKSLVAYTKGLLDVLVGAGATTFPTAAAAANSVTASAVLRYVSELQVPRVVPKAIAAAGTSFTTGLSPVTLYTVTGNVMCRVFAVVTTALASTLNNGTLAIGVSGATGGLIAATTMDGTNFPTNSVWAGDTAPTLLGKVFSATALNWFLVGNSTNIIATIATNSATAGAITFYCQYLPLNASSTVVAA